MITVNQRRYRVPAHPTVVVCVGGGEPDYPAQAAAHGQMPWLRQGLTEGTALLVAPFSGIKDLEPGDKEGAQEAMGGFTDVKTYALPWV